MLRSIVYIALKYMIFICMPVVFKSVKRAKNDLTLMIRGSQKFGVTFRKIARENLQGE